jgi:hypothetical protein
LLEACIWAAKVPPKVKTFAYKTASNALATKRNKRTRGMDVTGTCMICGREEEDTTLYICNHARQLLQVMRDL